MIYCLYKLIALVSNTDNYRISILVLLSGDIFGYSGVTVIELKTAIQVQIIDETVCLSHCANTLGKGMNLTILPSSKSK